MPSAQQPVSGVPAVYNVDISDCNDNDKLGQSCRILATRKDVPTNLRAIAEGSTTINLSWLDNSDNESGYVVHCHSNCPQYSNASTLDKYHELGVNAASNRWSLLTPEMEYCFQVKVKSPFGDSAYSNIACATTDPVKTSGGGMSLTGTFGVPGSGPGEFMNPGGVVVDRQGRIIVADTGNNRVQVCNETGVCTDLIGGGAFLTKDSSQSVKAIVQTTGFNAPEGVSSEQPGSGDRGRHRQSSNPCM